MSRERIRRRRFAMATPGARRARCGRGRDGRRAGCDLHGRGPCGGAARRAEPRARSHAAHDVAAPALRAVAGEQAGGLARLRSPRRARRADRLGLHGALPARGTAGAALHRRRGVVRDYEAGGLASARRRHAAHAGRDPGAAARARPRVDFRHPGAGTSPPGRRRRRTRRRVREPDRASGRRSLPSAFGHWPWSPLHRAASDGRERGSRNGAHEDRGNGIDVLRARFSTPARPLVSRSRAGSAAGAPPPPSRPRPCVALSRRPSAGGRRVRPPAGRAARLRVLRHRDRRPHRARDRAPATRSSRESDEHVRGTIERYLVDGVPRRAASRRATTCATSCARSRRSASAARP